MVACRYNHSLTAEGLIKWGAKVGTRTEYNMTALHYACYNNKMDCVKVLMAYDCPTGELWWVKGVRALIVSYSPCAPAVNLLTLYNFAR